MFKYVMEMHITRRFELNTARYSFIFRFSSAFIQFKAISMPDTNPHCKYSLNKEYYERAASINACMCAHSCVCVVYLSVYCASFSFSLSLSSFSPFYSHSTSKTCSSRPPRLNVAFNSRSKQFEILTIRFRSRLDIRRHAKRAFIRRTNRE